MALSKLVIGLVAGVAGVAAIGGVTAAVVTSNNRNTVNTVEKDENKENEKTSISTNRNRRDTETRTNKQDKVMESEESSEATIPDASQQQESASKEQDPSGGVMGMRGDKTSLSTTQTTVLQRPSELDRVRQKDQEQQVAGKEEADRQEPEQDAAQKDNMRIVKVPGERKEEEAGGTDDKSSGAVAEEVKSPEDSEKIKAA